MSFHRFLVLGNPNLALKYCSDVTGGHNCHLEVIIGGQSLKYTVVDLWVSFHSQNANQMLLEVKTTIWRSTGGQSLKSTVLDF